MLFWLFQQLAEVNPGFNVFAYITLRSILGALTALLVSLLLGPWFIRRLVKKQVGQPIRKLGPESHFSKAGTPTMGGALILFSIVLTTLLWADLSNRYVWVVLLVTLAFGLIGWVDDYKKLVLHVFYIVTTYFMIVGFSNAVNLTDGLDGLAIMPSVFVAAALGIFAYVAGNSVFSDYLAMPYIPGAGELSIFCGALAGAGLGFLWFNTYPAQIFMGDIGALAVGAALGVIAVIVRQELVFILMAGVFVMETVSVILQVASFKLTGKRIFRMAPIHHHFELKGWPEPRVIVRFWIISVILVLAGLATLKIR